MIKARWTESKLTTSSMIRFLLQIVFHQSRLILNRPEGDSNIAMFVIYVAA